MKDQDSSPEKRRRIPIHLRPLVRDVMEDIEDQTLEDGIRAYATSVGEGLAGRLMNKPPGSPERAEAIRRSRDFLELVELLEAA